ncbi:hypothetical protein ABH922_002778 [Rhodococcus sp. 27YEA15]|uniref:hypothetical protein n=1 Tax=Rhodococcus sp. 27YEA15 TaxID=3156259 RepID=UPI003C7C9196
MPVPTEPIPYDEMRRLCGLPDVRLKVAGDRMRLAGRRMLTACRQLNIATTIPTAEGYALAGGRR